MPRPRTIFLPPIMQVLEEGQHQHFYAEGVSNVIKWVDVDSVQLSQPSKKVTRPQTPLSHLMKTIDLRGDCHQEDDEERFSYIVCFPDDITVTAKDDKDTQTSSSQQPVQQPVKHRHSSPDLGPGSFWKNNVITRLTKAASIIMPDKLAHASESNFNRVQQ